MKKAAKAARADAGRIGDMGADLPEFKERDAAARDAENGIRPAMRQVAFQERADAGADARADLGAGAAAVEGDARPADTPDAGQGAVDTARSAHDPAAADLPATSDVPAPDDEADRAVREMALDAAADGVIEAHGAGAGRPPRPRVVRPDRMPTGIRLLDEMLDGGLPVGAPVLLQGPAFLGKEDLANEAVVACLRRGVPVIVVLTQKGHDEKRGEYQAIEPAYEDLERPEAIHFVDCYSRPLGEDARDELTDCTEDAGDLDGLAKAIDAARAPFDGKPHLLVLDSVSDLAMHHDAAKVFRFLQTLLGRTARARGTTLALLDDGMHDPAHVHMFRHLMRGAVTVRGDPGRQQMLVEGLTTARNPGWIEYRVVDSGLEMTGSLAGGRIR